MKHFFSVIAMITMISSFAIAQSASQTASAEQDKYASMSMATAQQYAEQGDVDAQFALASRYYYGQGTETNKTHALHWYEKSAEQGDARSQLFLGIMYFHGDGVEQDREQAVKWIGAAKAQGSEKAEDLWDALELGISVD